MRRAKKLYLAMGLALVAMLVAAGAVFAAVNFDSSTGTGFVGKGDVQQVFNWNNKQLQQNASGVTFSYNATENYEAVCTFVTGEGTRGEQTHNVSRERSTTVDSAVAYDPRVKNQITGFNLKGFGDTTSSGDVPVVGGACPGGPNGGTWTSVTLVSSTGGLYVNFGGTSIALPNTPPATTV
jgi:hypothetical protein